MTLDQQVHQNDVKLRKLTDEVKLLKIQLSELTTFVQSIHPPTEPKKEENK